MLTHRCPHSGALIFTPEPHEIEARETREKMVSMEKELQELREMVSVLLPKKEDDANGK